MIKCPKCGSEHVSIVTDVKSEKQVSNFIDIICAMSKFILVVFGLILILAIPFNIEAFFYILEGKANIAETLEISTTLIQTITVLNFFLKISKWLIIIIITTSIIKLLMPYKTHSKRKFVCHKCELEWDINKDGQNPS